MFSFCQVLTVKPEPGSPLEETSLKLSLQPLRLNIDQDTLFFIIDFVNSLMPTAEVAAGAAAADSCSPRGAAAAAAAASRSRSGSDGAARAPSHAEMPEVYEDARSSPPREAQQRLRGLSPPEQEDSFRSKSSTPAPSSSGGGGNHNNSLPDTVYIKSFLFAPAVPIRIDYVGKYVDLTQGALTGLLAGLAQLNCSEITLKQLELRQAGLEKKPTQKKKNTKNGVFWVF
jgi:autophagy-related protein 2